MRFSFNHKASFADKQIIRLPLPTPPPFELLKDVALDGLTISIVAYTVALSMALIFAQKNSYKVDANQELLAQVTAPTTTL